VTPCLRLVWSDRPLVGARSWRAGVLATVLRMRMLVVLVVSCGTPLPVIAPPLPATDPPLPAVGANSMGWPTWSRDRKFAYMRDTVLPAEKAIFARFEPLRFASLSCETCHGQGARDGTYRMPNPDLPHLDGGRNGFQELLDKQPETLRFMQKVVAPETARLLGYAEFDMEKHVGFSCYQCHVRQSVE
jgi:hypothetical protein